MAGIQQVLPSIHNAWETKRWPFVKKGSMTWPIVKSVL